VVSVIPEPLAADTPWSLPGPDDGSWFRTCAVILGSGRGRGGWEVVAFDYALRDAGIADFNLHRVTSIVPSGALVCSMPPGGQVLSGDGHHIPAVYEKVSSRTPGMVITAGIGIGVPRDRGRAGVIFPYSGEDLTGDECRSALAGMVGEGMLLRGGSYDFRCSVATDTVAEGGQWHAVLAVLSFADRHLWPYFEPHVELLS
jgi:arginine decarboxylase